MSEMQARVSQFERLVDRRVYGIDFSGARDAGKKIWVAAGDVLDGVLHIRDCYCAETLPNSGRERGRCLVALRELVFTECRERVIDQLAVMAPEGFRSLQFDLL